VKILVLCERVDDEGGTETYLRTLLPALRDRGHAIRVLARSAAQPGAYGVPVEAIEWSDEHDPPSAQAAAAVARAASSFAPDVAAVHNVLDAGVLDTARLHAPRVVYHLHDHRPFCPNGDRLYPQGGAICSVSMGTAACGWHALVNGCAYGPRARTLGLIRLRSSVARAVAAGDAAVALSRYIANLAHRNGVPANKVHVLAPPLDEDSFASAPAPRPERDAVLFAGRVVPSKGARSLVRALAALPEATRPVLRIAGDGPDLLPTLEEARARTVRVETLGRLRASGMRAAYDAATLAAMPSQWGEPFGLVGIEAFARGRPVAAYDAGAIAEWLAPSGGGRLAPLNDEHTLAEAIAELLRDDVWERASANAFDAAQTYRPAAHVDRIEALYAGRAERLPCPES
jgi:glycosyltransferase involved in cell wall biosynthesis